MTRYIVTYDLSKPGQNYEALKKRITAYKSHVYVMQSTWGISNNASAEQIWDYLNEALDSNDKLLVAPWGTPSAWVGLPKSVSDWIKEHA